MRKEKAGRVLVQWAPWPAFAENMSRVLTSHDAGDVGMNREPCRRSSSIGE